MDICILLCYVIWKTLLLGISSGNCNEVRGRLRLEKCVHRQRVLLRRIV